MPETIKIDHESQVPVYKQIVGQVEALVRSGEYAEGCLLPSMNELSAMLDISKETVKKAYSILRNKGFIDARQGKGFYVSAAGVSEKMSVLVLFDKLSNYKAGAFQLVRRGDRRRRPRSPSGFTTRTSICWNTTSRRISTCSTTTSSRPTFRSTPPRRNGC